MYTAQEKFTNSPKKKTHVEKWPPRIYPHLNPGHLPWTVTRQHAGFGGTCCRGYRDISTRNVIKNATNKKRNPAHMFAQKRNPTEPQALVC